MKRKAEADLDEHPSKRKAANGSTQFRSGLLQQADKYREQYITSEPYKHGVIQDLLEPQLLRTVRSEIQANLSFTPKETDIYKIHQSGDLANLDGLDDSSLSLLPSLLTLRDALYSPAFRSFLSTVTAAGPLSGKKTDMAINVYTPGCHLLCHDDVIGSRRVSYILYLTDPDRPWKPEWGGALRLYPTNIHKREDGTEVKAPSPDSTVSIPPAFNQLSFFAVQPGESFHDVEEVYAHKPGSEDETDESRIRMAISGWYHIPQEGEDGYVEGLEESLAERSSLQQLQSSNDQYDQPQPCIHRYSKPYETATAPAASGVSPMDPTQDEASLSEKDLDFLLKYIAPTYLTPDTLESVCDTFSDECSICLGQFLNKKFSSSLKDHLSQEEVKALPGAAEEIGDTTAWRVARPPHKSRFLYQRASDNGGNDQKSPIQDLLQDLLPSDAFRKWLQLATGLVLSSHDCCARRFRRGKDYTLATGYNGEESQLEIILAMTPSQGWGGDEGAAADEEVTGSKKSDGIEETPSEAPSRITNTDPGEPNLGGYVAYMAGDDDDEDNKSNNSHGSDGVEVPQDLSTGARASRPSTQKRKLDPAVYKASADEEDDGVLFSMPACWNTLGLVLRDQGVLRFVKYVSQQAPGDRWDIVGEFGVIQDDEKKSTDNEPETQQATHPSIYPEHEESETEIESSDDEDEDEDEDDDDDE
ncbi:MAG: hypothetical protein Q9219_003190 [cf. Caloplaca sp. 3 TL-2023]